MLRVVLLSGAEVKTHETQLGTATPQPKKKIFTTETQSKPSSEYSWIKTKVSASSVSLWWGRASIDPLNFSPDAKLRLTGLGSMIGSDLVAPRG